MSSGWFTSTATYVETIWSVAPPEYEEDGKTVKKEGEGETAEVTFRALNAGDQSDIQDILRMEMGDGIDDERHQLLIGRMRLMSVERAVVDWTIPGSKPSPETLRQLAPIVFDQIYSYVRLGREHPTSPPAPPAASIAPAANGDGDSSKIKPTRSSGAVP